MLYVSIYIVFIFFLELQQSALHFQCFCSICAVHKCTEDRTGRRASWPQQMALPSDQQETSNHPPQPQLRHISSSFTNSWPGFHNFYGAIPRRDRRHNRDTLPSLLWLYTPIKQHSFAKELIRQPQFSDRLLGINSFTYNHFNKSIWVHRPRGTMQT